MPSIRVFGLGLLVVCAAPAQTEKKLTARELFYTPIATAKAAPAPAKPPVSKSPAAKPPAAKPVPPAPTSAPLALRYSLLKENSAGDYAEIDPDTVFRSGDGIKVSVEANDNAHLYIVQQGSSKVWTVLFPNSDTGQGDNRVERNRRVTVPAGGRFAFDDQPGTERLFLVLSRQAEPDLERLIYDLNKTTAPADGGRPKMMLAQNRIDDSVVNRLRTQMVARDLVFEKVNYDNTSSGKREKAMYYGTPDSSSRARIVVDVSLRHQ